jgi:hypothetical protein
MPETEFLDLSATNVSTVVREAGGETPLSTELVVDCYDCESCADPCCDSCGCGSC